METKELKKDIHKIVDKINDNNVLNAIRILLYNQISQTENVDFWDELPENVKDSINKGIGQAENNILTPHNEVMQNIKSKYLS